MRVCAIGTDYVGLVTDICLAKPEHEVIGANSIQQVLKILKGKTIGLLGLTFKPDTDDLRALPALELIEQLQRLGTKVKAYEPIVSIDSQHPGLQNVQRVATPAALAVGCAALVLVAGWQEFQHLNFAQLGELMEFPILIDGRNFVKPAQAVNAGFYYLGMERSVSTLGRVGSVLPVGTT